MQQTEVKTPVKIREQCFTVGEVTMNAALTSGHGPPVVMLHGVSRCWQDFLPVIPALAELGHVIALDHRGHGGSSKGLPSYKVCDYVGDAVAFIQAHVTEPMVLIGHSLGAMTAAGVAARLPQMVKALVLEEPPGTLLTSGLKASRYWLQFTGIQRLMQEGRCNEHTLAMLPVQHPLDGRTVLLKDLRDEAALKFSAECLAKLDLHVFDDLLESRWLDGTDWFSELAEIRCPTLLMRADVSCGGMLSEQDALRIESSIQQCERIDLPEQGHNIHGTAPARYLDLVTRFLQPLLLDQP
jgi:pimeloyl-ACP methyl ester carboxylesterase